MLSRVAPSIWLAERTSCALWDIGSRSRSRLSSLSCSRCGRLRRSTSTRRSRLCGHPPPCCTSSRCWQPCGSSAAVTWGLWLRSPDSPLSPSGGSRSSHRTIATGSPTTPKPPTPTSTATRSRSTTSATATTAPRNDYTCQWETRSYNLANLSGVDIFITWWGSPWIAHPIVSFDFGDQGHVAMSIETRDVVGQGYSAIRGFFRQYALTYIASDERDVVRLRTNYRKDEEVYLFRTTVNATDWRAELFLEYLQRANNLHQRPEWYNALTNNCTTNIAVSAAQARDVRTRLDWRILLNGKMDEMMYERGALVTGGLPLPALKEQAHINAAARAADDSPDFSKLIREGRVGFTERPSLAMSVPGLAKISKVAILPE